MNNVIGLLVCMWLRAWKHVGSNLGLKEMDPLYFYVLLGDQVRGAYCVSFVWISFIINVY